MRHCKTISSTLVFKLASHTIAKIIPIPNRSNHQNDALAARVRHLEYLISSSNPREEIDRSLYGKVTF
jgi:hypothetical protein